MAVQILEYVLTIAVQKLDRFIGFAPFYDDDARFPRWRLRKLRSFDVEFLRSLKGNQFCTENLLHINARVESAELGNVPTAV